MYRWFRSEHDIPVSHRQVPYRLRPYAMGRPLLMGSKKYRFTLCVALAACSADQATGTPALVPQSDATTNIVDATGQADSSVRFIRDAGVMLRHDAAEEGTDSGTADDDFVYTCTPVGPSHSDGFFSLEAFDGKLYAGLFGYGRESQSMLYRYAPWELTSPGLTGISESICALAEFDGQLYANTESSGDIFRSSDGTTWERVYDGGNETIGCGLAVFQGQLFAINYGNARNEHGLILRKNGDTWETVYDSGRMPLYIREIVAYDGVLYAFGVQDLQGQMLSSRDGSNWRLQTVANRYIRGHVWNDYLWLGSTDYYANGEVGIWRFDGTDFVKVHADTHRYVTDIEHLDGRLFAGTSNGWKTESGPSALLMSPDGENDWQTICQFSETAVWSMAVFENELYLGTWDYGATGAIYKVSRSAVAPTDCALISANSAWEVCETGASYCAGVFTDGAGCESYCAAAGLTCTARYGGEPGCQKEPQNVLSCDDSNGHRSDWCECGRRTSPNPMPQGCHAQAGRLAIDEVWTVSVDAHTGDEDTTQPKTDLNHGTNGDNPQFRRHNVARAHNDYWYTSSYQENGEPNPRDAQWVDYAPDFGALGVGCYRIEAQYRGTDARATYAAHYRILGARAPDILIEDVQQRRGGAYVDVNLGNHFMCPASMVRIQDPGPNSITFNRMRFTYLGNDCP